MLQHRVKSLARTVLQISTNDRIFNHNVQKIRNVSVSYLNPGVGAAKFFNKLCPLVNHLDNLLFFHEREGDIRPGMEAHDLTVEHMRRGRVTHQTGYAASSAIVLNVITSKRPINNHFNSKM